MGKIDDDMIFEINAEINAKATYLFEVATGLVDIFHEERKAYIDEAKRSKNKYRSPHLICRVTRNETLIGITIAWYQNEYVGERGRRRAISKYIKRGKKPSYSADKVFTYKTLDWERRLFHELEPKFAVLRQHSLELGKLSREVMRYQTALGKIKLESTE